MVDFACIGRFCLTAAEVRQLFGGVVAARSSRLAAWVRYSLDAAAVGVGMIRGVASESAQRGTVGSVVGVAQLVERRVVVADVAGSSPVTHPTKSGV